MLHKHMASVEQASVVAVTIKLAILNEFAAQVASFVTEPPELIVGSGTSGMVNRPFCPPGQTR